MNKIFLKLLIGLPRIRHTYVNLNLILCMIPKLIIIYINFDLIFFDIINYLNLFKIQKNQYKKKHILL